LIVGAVITALIGLASSPAYFPGLRDRLFGTPDLPATVLVPPAGATSDVSTSAGPGISAPPSATHASAPVGFICHTAAVKPVSAVPPPDPQVARKVEWIPAQYALPSSITKSDLAGMSAAARKNAGDIHKWVYDHGGAEVISTMRRIVFQGLDEPVVITGMHAIVLERTPSLCGGLVWTGLGGVTVPLVASLDLDSSAPAAPEFRNRVINLAPGEQATVDLTATALRSEVTWDLGVDYTVGGRAREKILHSDTLHFRTTGQSGSASAHLLPNPRRHYESEAYYGPEGVTRLP
jgi:hypothetical protein